MIAPPKPRTFKVSGPLLLGVALTFSLMKFALVNDFNASGPSSDAPGRVVEVPVRLDTGLLSPLNVEDKKGEMVISVKADDLDEIAERVSEKELPRVPNMLLHDPFLCDKVTDLSFILYVHSAPENRERRDRLRATYANTRLFKRRRFVVVFLLGLPKEFGVQELVRKEFDEHRDIVQGFFIDDYRNMTLKAIMGLNWITSHCSRAPFAVKVDDDTFLDIFEIVRIAESNAGRPLVLACPVWREGTMRVLRDRKTCMKWCVTKREYAGVFYPRYCAGIGYALSQQLMAEMRRMAETTPFFWIDDVYVTGMLVQPIIDKIHYVDLMPYFTVNENQALEQFESAAAAAAAAANGTSQRTPVSSHLIHVRSTENFFRLWKHVLHRLSPHQMAEVNDDVIKTSLL